MSTDDTQPPGGQDILAERGDQPRSRGHRLGHRPRQGMVPEFLTGDHDVQRAGAEPAPALRYRQRGDSGPGELAPHRQAIGLIPAGPLSRGTGHVGGREHLM